MDDEKYRDVLETVFIQLIIEPNIKNWSDGNMKVEISGNTSRYKISDESKSITEFNANSIVWHDFTPKLEFKDNFENKTILTNHEKFVLNNFFLQIVKEPNVKGSLPLMIGDNPYGISLYEVRRSDSPTNRYTINRYQSTASTTLEKKGITYVRKDTSALTTPQEQALNEFLNPSKAEGFANGASTKNTWYFKKNNNNSITMTTYGNKQSKIIDVSIVGPASQKAGTDFQTGGNGLVYSKYKKYKTKYLLNKG